MSECIYWMEDGNSPWCDLAQGACNCKGNESSCYMGGNKVVGALRAERRACNHEAMLRAQKRRMHAEIERRTH